MLIFCLFFVCVVVENYIFVVGGYDNSKFVFKLVEVYSVDIDQWVFFFFMNEEWDEFIGLCFDGNFYVVSGYFISLQGQFIESVEVYSLLMNFWILLYGMWLLEREIVCFFGFFVVMFGRFYILNGYNFCSYNVGIGVWLVVEFIFDSEVNFVCVVVVDDVFVIIGLFCNREELGFGIFLYKLVERNVIKWCKSEWESIER